MQIRRHRRNAARDHLRSTNAYAYRALLYYHREGPQIVSTSGIVSVPDEQLVYPSRAPYLRSHHRAPAPLPQSASASRSSISCASQSLFCNQTGYRVGKLHTVLVASPNTVFLYCNTMSLFWLATCQAAAVFFFIIPLFQSDNLLYVIIGLLL